MNDDDPYDDSSINKIQSEVQALEISNGELSPRQNFVETASRKRIVPSISSEFSQTVKSGSMVAPQPSAPLNTLASQNGMQKSASVFTSTGVGIVTKAAPEARCFAPKVAAEGALPLPIQNSPDFKTETQGAHLIGSLTKQSIGKVAGSDMDKVISTGQKEVDNTKLPRAAPNHSEGLKLRLNAVESSSPSQLIQTMSEQMGGNEQARFINQSQCRQSISSIPQQSPSQKLAGAQQPGTMQTSPGLETYELSSVPDSGRVGRVTTAAGLTAKPILVLRNMNETHEVASYSPDVMGARQTHQKTLSNAQPFRVSSEFKDVAGQESGPSQNRFIDLTSPTEISPLCPKDLIGLLQKREQGSSQKQLAKCNDALMQTPELGPKSQSASKDNLTGSKQVIQSTLEKSKQILGRFNQSQVPSMLPALQKADAASPDAKAHLGSVYLRQLQGFINSEETAKTLLRQMAPLETPQEKTFEKKEEGVQASEEYALQQPAARKMAPANRNLPGPALFRISPSVASFQAFATEDDARTWTRNKDPHRYEPVQPYSQPLDGPLPKKRSTATAVLHSSGSFKVQQPGGGSLKPPEAGDASPQPVIITALNRHAAASARNIIQQPSLDEGNGMIADGSAAISTVHRPMPSGFSQENLPPYMPDKTDEESKMERQRYLMIENALNLQDHEELRIKAPSKPIVSTKTVSKSHSHTAINVVPLSLRNSTNDSNLQLQQIVSEHKDANGSRIEEEMTFEELSSKLGNVLFADGRAPSKTTAAHATNQMRFSLPFTDLNSSVAISQRSLPNSAEDESHLHSRDFENLPALMADLDAETPLSIMNEDALGRAAPKPAKPRFEYEQRLFNHFNVNKMGQQGKVMGHRGSFIGDKNERQNYTEDSEQIAPIVQGRFGDRRIGEFFQTSQANVTPMKGLEAHTLLKGLETPDERSELYENFDIFHEGVATAPVDDLFCTEVPKGDEGMRSLETYRSISDVGGPTSGKKPRDSYALDSRRQSSKKLISSGMKERMSSEKKVRKRVYDLTKETAATCREKLLSIFDLADSGSTVKLPPLEIPMPNVVLKKAFNIVGQPGTSLFFKSTTLKIDTCSNGKLEKDFRFGPVVSVSEVQFQFWIDMRSVGFNHQRTHLSSLKFISEPTDRHKQKCESSQPEYEKLNTGAKSRIALAANPTSRTLVGLITLMSGSKAHFRDCSFRSVKVFNRNSVSLLHSLQQQQLLQQQQRSAIRSKRRFERSSSSQTHTGQDLVFTSKSAGGQLHIPSAHQKLDSLSANNPSDNDVKDSAGLAQGGYLYGQYFTSEKEEEQILRENVHEICFWLNAEAMNDHPACMHEYRAEAVTSPSHRKQPYRGSLQLQSCVISGFYNQVRGGCNCTLELEKCYLQDSKSSALMLVNPCYFRMVESNLIRCQINSGVNIRWLPDSRDKHMSRVIEIKHCDFGFNFYCGVEIQGNKYSAHNIKVDISHNNFYRNKKDGLLVANLALTGLLLYGNEFIKNEQDNLKLSHVHHKGSKRNVLRIENSQSESSKGGFGFYLFDTSVTVKSCVVKGNQSGGIFVGCPERPSHLTDEALIFLKKFPMSVKVSSCEITQNMHYGMMVQDFWKGSIILKHTLLQANCNFGLWVHAKEPLPSPREQKLLASLDQELSGANLFRGFQVLSPPPHIIGHSSQRKPALQLFTRQSAQINHSEANMNYQSLKTGQSQYLLRTKVKANSSMQSVAGASAGKLPVAKLNVGTDLNVNLKANLAAGGASPSNMRPLSNPQAAGITQERNHSHSIQMAVKAKPPAAPTSARRETLTIEDQRPNELRETPREPAAYFDDDQVLNTQRRLLSNGESEQLGVQPNSDHAHGADSRLAFQSPSVIQQRNQLQQLQLEKNGSFASSLMASLRRVQPNTRTDSDQRHYRKRASILNFLPGVGGAQSSNQGLREESQANIHAEISRQITVHILQQIEAKLVAERQQLGKVYITDGTAVVKNGGAGIAVRHVAIEIDDHAKTRVQDNDFGFQVYVMLKQCERLLTGFELAMIEGRIRGRKVLVGGGWGQMTPQMPTRLCCCVTNRFVRPCYDAVARLRSSRPSQVAPGAVQPVSYIQELPKRSVIASRASQLRKAEREEAQGANELESNASPDVNKRVTVQGGSKEESKEPVLFNADAESNPIKLQENLKTPVQVVLPDEQPHQCVIF